MALTTAAPMSCSRMSSHCIVALEANWHLWFSSRSLWFFSSNLGEARGGSKATPLWQSLAQTPRQNAFFLELINTPTGLTEGTERSVCSFTGGLLCPTIPFFCFFPLPLSAFTHPSLLRQET